MNRALPCNDHSHNCSYTSFAMLFIYFHYFAILYIQPSNATVTTVTTIPTHFDVIIIVVTFFTMFLLLEICNVFYQEFLNFSKLRISELLKKIMYDAFHWFDAIYSEYFILLTILTGTPPLLKPTNPWWHKLRCCTNLLQSSRCCENLHKITRIVGALTSQKISRRNVSD